MTEIPEHLLARSKARRSAIGQSEGGGEAAAEAAPSTAVEKAAPAAAAPAGPAGPTPPTPSRAPAAPELPPEKPRRPEVVAALTRKKIPYWAMPALIALPAWAFLYSYTMDPRKEESPVIAEGRAIYSSSCASCHGPTGGGGVGAVLAGGEVELTFPAYADQVTWVHLGAAGDANPDGTYGDPNREGGPHSVNDLPGIMPPFEGTLSDDQILAVVRFEREVISGFGCEPDLATATGEECEPGTEAQTAAP